MSRSGKMILVGIAGLVLSVIGIMDLMTTNVYYIAQGEDETIDYYLFIGIPLLILSIVGLVRQNRRIK